MGDYSYCRGTAKIKPALVEVLRDRFTRPTDDVDLDLWGDWNFVTLPECLVATSAYKLLCVAEKGSWIPGTSTAMKSRHLGEPGEESLTYSADGVLTFHVGYKNANPTIEAFIALLIVCSDTYMIEYDWYETLYCPDWDNPDSGLTVFDSSSITPETIKELQDKVDRNLADALKTREEFSPGQWRDKPKELSDYEKTFNFNMHLAATLKRGGYEMQGVVDPLAPMLGLTVEQIQMLRTMGVPEDMLNASNPVYFAKHVAERVAGTPFINPTAKHTASAPVDARQVPVSVPDFNPLAHIMAQKLYARGSMGVRQIKRAQRRKMNGK